MNGENTLAFGSNAGYLAELYQLYLTDPSLVDPAWAEFFRENGAVQGNGAGVAVANGHPVVATNGAAALQVATPTPAQAVPGVDARALVGGFVAARVVDAFRRNGHAQARISPLVAGGVAPEQVAELKPEFYQELYGAALGAAKAGSVGDAPVHGVSVGSSAPASLGALCEQLEAIYCGSVGFEFMHLTRSEEREWLQQRIEARTRAGWFDQRSVTQVDLLTELVQAELFESELHRKYVGTKRFSLEGNDTLIPVLRSVVNYAAASGVREIVCGMAHRGRLNVLANTLRKPLERLFAEFEDRTLASVQGAGDVKYHLGFETRYDLPQGQVQISMVPNPSHLEFVNPVVAGVVRARQDLEYGRDRRAVLALTMHGDAAFAGQGVVFETVNFSGVDGYRTGGTLHIVINNQIGFTTTPDESRSTRYCTDLAKGVDAPIFHVNCEDPESACWVAELALDFRNQFGKDVFIDLIGHRKHGHNEGDDPSFTQPLTYQELKTKRPIWQQYAERLVGAGVVTQDQVDRIVAEYKERFSAAHQRVVTATPADAAARVADSTSTPAVTAVDGERLKVIARALLEYPSGFVVHPKLGKINEKRVEAVENGEGIEWGVAELLAFGSLVLEGRSVRLSGQDCCRGTFSHRHAVLDNFEAGESARAQNRSFSPLALLSQRESGAGSFEVFNSPLSEAGILGFEFGYGSIAPKTLVMWEAQFGDFSNGAQVIIDQFICSSEEKWEQRSGVTLLLPHAFEGQGPEHSSARLERYLQLCAGGNMTVCYPTTAAQIFHLLRRQALAKAPRPLVVMTPKSLLRFPGATSALTEFSSGGFAPLVRTDLGGGKKSDHLVVVTGKVYYDVLAALQAAGKLSASIVRLEQLYPFPAAELEVVAKQSKAKSVIWVQEEPQNMGAWSYVAPLLEEAVGIRPVYCGRPGAGSPATGSSKWHAIEQKRIMSALVDRVQGA